MPHPPPPLPDDLRARLQPHIRTAWLPVTEAVDKGAPKPKRLQVVRALSLVSRPPPDAEGAVSKLAGRPWLKAGEAWPACPNCGKPMALFLQLDLASLPEGAPDFGQGLVQLFYCVTTKPLCEVDCEAFRPFARSVVARLLSPKELESGGTAPSELSERDAYDRAHHIREPQVIVGWKKAEDLPRPKEIAGLPWQQWDEFSDALHAAERPLSGLKLAGWPHWVQDVEYPACPRCQTKMQLVFQVDSQDALGVQFGDIGCAHLTQCPVHKDVLAFAWACH